MKAPFIDEKTGIPYALVGDDYLPRDDLPDDAIDDNPIGVWGQRHLRYLKEHRKVLYSELLPSGKRNSYLIEIDLQAHDMFSRPVYELAGKESVIERPKAENQMEWVCRMNNIRDRARELVNSEIICA